MLLLLGWTGQLLPFLLESPSTLVGTAQGWVSRWAVGNPLPGTPQVLPSFVHSSAKQLSSIQAVQTPVH